MAPGSRDLRMRRESADRHRQTDAPAVIANGPLGRLRERQVDIPMNVSPQRKPRPDAPAEHLAVRPHADPPRQSPLPRPHVGGKFIYRGDEKLYLRGVTYGTFGPAGPEEYGDELRVERDF